MSIPIHNCREEIPTLNDKCSKCGKNPICFLEGKDDEIYEVFNKCKECLMGFNLITEQVHLDEWV